MLKKTLFILMLQTMSIASLSSSSSINKEIRRMYKFSEACKQNKTEEVKKILEKSKQSTCNELINTKFIGYTIWFLETFPLLLAIENNNLELINILLTYGADPNIIDKQNKTTPLIKLFQTEECSQTTAITQVLLKAGANPNIKNCTGDTPLVALLSSSYRHSHLDTIDIIKALIGAGANPKIIGIHDTSPLTALFLNAENHQTNAIAQALLDAGADPNIENNFRRTPLITLFQKNKKPSFETVQTLLNAGANPNIIDIYDIAPLETFVHCIQKTLK